MAQVGISSDYFKKALNDYSNWKWAIVREFMQNGIDCSSKEINVEIGYDEILDFTILKVTNDGPSMSQETMEQKLMCIGASTKDGTEETGGFGLAKVVLYLSHNNYSIHSGTNLLIGAGGEYEIKQVQNFNGTSSFVRIKGNIQHNLAQQFRTFAQFAQWKGILTIKVGNETIISDTGVKKITPCDLHKGCMRKEFSFGKLYTNRKFSNILVFRINGIPMFTRHVDFEGCVVVEGNKNSIDLLTSNRDGLKWQYQNEIDSVVNAFTTNRSSIFKQEPEIEIYGNTLITAGYKTITETQNFVAPETQEPETQEPEDKTSKELDTTMVVASIKTFSKAISQFQEFLEVPTLPADGKRFIIFNDSGFKTPEHTRPESMSNYCSKLLQVWTNLIIKLHDLDENHGEFGVGFAISEAIAKHTRIENVTYYMINPFEIVEQKRSNSKSLRKRIKFSEKEELIMYAVHEYTHRYYSGHDERYAAKLTELSTLAMRNLSSLKRCFKI